MMKEELHIYIDSMAIPRPDNPTAYCSLFCYVCRYMYIPHLYIALYC